MKQYLLMIDEQAMVFINQLMPKMKFLEVGGLTLTDHLGFKALVTPVNPPEVKVDEETKGPLEQIADQLGMPAISEAE